MRKIFLLALPVLLAGPQFFASAGEVDRVAPGTEVTVRTDEPIEIRSWDRGRIYRGQLIRDVYATDGDLAFPRGADAELIVRQVGDREMVVDLEAIYVNGRRYIVDASSQEVNTRDRPGVGENRRTAKYVGGGAIIGSIIGAIAGGGKGAAIRRCWSRRRSRGSDNDAWARDSHSGRIATNVPAGAAATIRRGSRQRLHSRWPSLSRVSLAGVEAHVPTNWDID